MHVAIQGIAGSFHEEAAYKLMPSKFDLVPCETFQEVFKAVKNGTAEYGVVAVENSLHGSINAVYRLLSREGLWVGGEIYLHINQYLIGPKKITLNELNKSDAKVYSQAPALEQCELWLDKNMPAAKRLEMHDTAESVKLVLGTNDAKQVAIASKHAAELYGGVIIDGPINDDPHNYTRFFLLSKSKAKTTKADKTSVILTTSHKPGALYHALGVFAGLDINLSKLDSHPIAGDRLHYAFYVDFDKKVDDPDVIQAFATLKAQKCDVKILGSYAGRSLPV